MLLFTLNQFDDVFQDSVVRDLVIKTIFSNPDVCVFPPQMVLTAFSRVGMLREASPHSAWRKTP